MRKSSQGGNALKYDLYEHLRNILNAVSNLSHPKDADTIFNILQDSESQEETTLIQRALRFMHCDESP